MPPVNWAIPSEIDTTTVDRPTAEEHPNWNAKALAEAQSAWDTAEKQRVGIAAANARFGKERAEREAAQHAEKERILAEQREKRLAPKLSAAKAAYLASGGTEAQWPHLLPSMIEKLARLEAEQSLQPEKPTPPIDQQMILG